MVVQELLHAGLTLTPSPSPGPAADRIHVLAQRIATIVTGMLAWLAAVIACAAAMKNKDATLAAAGRTDKRERENAERLHNREVMAAPQGRYAQVAVQLANAQTPVRLAGIYALSALADEWQEVNQNGQRGVCVNLLFAYLREPPRYDGDYEGL